MKKYASRKFILSILQLILLVGLPIGYHHLGISDDLCKMVIFGILGNSLYHFANVLEGRVRTVDDDKQA